MSKCGLFLGGRESILGWCISSLLMGNLNTSWIYCELASWLMKGFELFWIQIVQFADEVESLDEGKTKQESLKWRDGMFEAFQSSRQMHFPVQRTQTKDCLLSNWIWFKVLSSDLIFRWIMNSKIIINCWCISPFKRKCFVFWMQRACVRCNLWRCAHCLITWDEREGEGGCESAETRIVRDPGAVLHFPRSRGSQTSLLACVAHWSYT